MLFFVPVSSSPQTSPLFPLKASHLTQAPAPPYTFPASTNYSCTSALPITSPTQVSPLPFYPSCPNQISNPRFRTPLLQGPTSFPPYSMIPHLPPSPPLSPKQYLPPPLALHPSPYPLLNPTSFLIPQLFSSFQYPPPPHPPHPPVLL